LDFLHEDWNVWLIVNHLIADSFLRKVKGMIELGPYFFTKTGGNQKIDTKDGGVSSNGRWKNRAFDRFDTTNTIGSYKMKMHNTKRSVLNCFKAKNHTQLSIYALLINSMLLTPPNLPFQIGANELNHGLRVNYGKKPHENSVWCMPVYP
jgi:hypothetical protein